MKDLLIAISLANLCMIQAWNNIYFTLLPTNQYYMKYPSSLNHFVAVLLFVLILGTLFFGAITFARRSSSLYALKVARLALLFVLTIPINGIIKSYKIATMNNLTLIIIIYFLLLLIIIIRLYLYFRHRIYKILVILVLVLFPYFLLNLLQNIWLLGKLDMDSFLDKPAVEKNDASNSSAPRVLWLIFDEMGQQISFDDRSSTVKLPAIDSLREQSFYAINAYPPAGVTDIVLPSLISGEMISTFNPLNANELLIKKYGSDIVAKWSEQPNIFLKAYELGYNTKLIGWYHPFGRVIGSSLTECSWYPYETLRFMSLQESLINQFEIFIDTIPFVKHYRTQKQIYIMDLLAQEDRIRTYQKMMDEVKDATINPELGLILVHLPVPHPPGLYNRSKNDFLISGGSYLDNLVLVDNTMGEIRRAMEDAGTWESTVVIFTSDHWWRTDMWSEKSLWTKEDNEASLTNNLDHRIPFMVKLAEQDDIVIYDKTFNSIITHDLILALLNNNISNSNELVDWINNNRTKWDIPDYN